LLETVRGKLEGDASDAGVDLKQTLAKDGKELGRKAGRYAHARQFKRMRRAIKRQRTIVGRLQREIDRKASAIGAAVRQAMGETLDKAARIVSQSGQRKAQGGQPKLYAWHAPEVDCISKGKARTPRYHLKGERSDRLHALLCAAGHNIRYFLKKRYGHKGALNEGRTPQLDQPVQLCNANCRASVRCVQFGVESLKPAVDRLRFNVQYCSDDFAAVCCSFVPQEFQLILRQSGPIQ
jgi:hypothetical protein